MSELHAGSSAILAALSCWRWLLDQRRRAELATLAIAAWMHNELLPHLTPRYAERVHIAFLASPLRAKPEQDTTTAASHSGPQRPNHGYLIAIFIDEAAAYQWLAQ